MQQCSICLDDLDASGPTLACGHRFHASCLARLAGANAVGVLLTGMGKDGAAGLVKMRQAGASTLAQDEASCVIYGMPMAVAKANLADGIYPLDDIGRYLAEIG